MRYVGMVLAIGLVSLITVAFATVASAEPAGDGAIRMETEPVQSGLARLSESISTANDQNEAWVALQNKNREATGRFGQWGPLLIDAGELYGQSPDEMFQVMWCESKGDPNADNGVNKGLFQFHPSTFAGTPYGGASIYDPHAQIMAAAWMWSQGRKGEWGCA